MFIVLAFSLTSSVAMAAEGTSLDPLVKLLSQVDDVDFQLDLLKGMREGIRVRNMQHPKMMC